jgi:hypothetical protein
VTTGRAAGGVGLGEGAGKATAYPQISQITQIVRETCRTGGALSGRLQQFGMAV